MTSKRKTKTPGDLLAAFAAVLGAALAGPAPLPLPLLSPPAAEADTKGIPQPELQGKIIRNVTVVVKPIFDDPDLGTLYRTANQLKIETREYVVRRELMFKEGDRYDDFVTRESERRLRSFRFLRNVAIVGKADGDYVDLEVAVQDTWTLVPQASFSSSSGSSNRSIGLAESNVAGFGKRLEILARESDNRQGTEFVYDDPRVWGTRNRLLGAFFDREDGERKVLFVGRPFFTLVDKFSWSTDIQDESVVGRLFEAGDESYIYRRNATIAGARYTLALGDASSLVRRYSLGVMLSDEEFSQAGPDDYEALNLDPNEVSNDPARLPENRRFYGPSIGYQFIEPDFVSMNYVDRFQRVEDYNLGNTGSIDLSLVPDFFGSSESAVIANVNRGGGVRFSPTSFLRAEAGLGSRILRDQLENTLVRGEVKFYNVLGSLFAGDRFLGKHTLAAGFFFDYGNDLDRDRQFVLGGEEALRGYKARAFTGDKRLAFNLEDRVHLVDDAFRLLSVGAAAFFDAGGATNETLGSILTDDLYSDVGVGLRIAFPRSSGGSIIRFDVAVPLRDGPDGTNAFEPRFVIGTGQVFGARLRSESVGVERSNVEVGFDR